MLLRASCKLHEFDNTDNNDNDDTCRDQDGLGNAFVVKPPLVCWIAVHGADARDAWSGDSGVAAFIYFVSFFLLLCHSVAIIANNPRLVTGVIVVLRLVLQKVWSGQTLADEQFADSGAGSSVS